MTDPADSAAAMTSPAVRYVPEEVETRWIAEWDRRGTFEAEVDESREPYTIVVPPPNVTGALHMGHALNGSVQDCLVRWKRMAGYNALWIPGVDHAGIATQSVVEKELRKEGTTRHELGRAAFIERTQAWKDQYAETIHGQFRRLGASMDFRRARFTMDEGYERAVLEAFVRLYDRKAIYRDNYLINWDAGTMSAISDLEVEQKELVDEMVQVAYPLVDGDGEIVIATARPETIVADVAIAVHPNDERYAKLVGRHVRVPLTDRTVPIIADDYVDIAFGTGALKITPGHDPNDFEIGLRHELEQLSAIALDRTMTALAGEWAGMGVDAAKVAMLERLEEEGLVRAREDYRHNVPHSQRSGVRIEPLISLQWFADMRELAKPALAAARDGSVRFVPEGSKKIFFGWMEALRPWCLSRQLWWGHQLPVWYCAADESHVHVSVDGPGAQPCPDCGGIEWRRDEDVLDTWFSSGLWDSATLGWPDDTPELRHFHPTNVLCTARDIINLWVARMMMFSLDFLGEVPFHDVYIHSVIQAPDGRRMSKSLGTGIDPLELIEEFGADATRYGLLDMSSTQDVRFNKGRIQEGRDLANKLWNASRLLVMLGDAEVIGEPLDVAGADRLEDRWILARLDRVSREVTRALGAYEFALAVKALYAFTWHELCDWYLESVKARLRSNDAVDRGDATRTLSFVLDRTVRLMHPVMPHITEEIAAQVWGTPDDADGCVATSTWHGEVFAEGVAGTFADAEVDFARLQVLVSRLRSLRQAADIKPKVRLAAALEVTGDEGSSWPASARLLGELAGVDVDAAASTSGGVTIPIEGATLTLHGLDPSVLKTRLQADLLAAEGEATRASKKLENERFTSRAPEELVGEERAKVERFSREADQLRAVLEQLG